MIAGEGAAPDVGEAGHAEIDGGVTSLDCAGDLGEFVLGGDEDGGSGSGYGYGYGYGY